MIRPNSDIHLLKFSSPFLPWFSGPTEGQPTSCPMGEAAGPKLRTQQRKTMTTPPEQCVIFSDLWMLLQIVWLQFEVARGPVGVVSARFEASLGPFWPEAGPKSTPTGTRTTSNCSHMSCSRIPCHFYNGLAARRRPHWRTDVDAFLSDGGGGRTQVLT